MNRQSKIRLNLVFVTQDEPFYLPEFFEAVFAALGQEVKGLVLLQPRVGKNSPWKTVQRYLSLYGVRDFLVLGAQFAGRRLLGRLKPVLALRKNYSIANVARQFQIPIFRPVDVNALESRQWIGSHDPDLIVSISAPQIFKPALLNLPRLGCINLHGGPLPRYQGMMPSFWVLMNGEKETASTVHWMTPKIDDGEILAQVRVPIFSADTLDALIRRSKAAGSRAILETIGRFRGGELASWTIDKGQCTYFGFPTRKDRQRFIELGHRFR